MTRDDIIRMAREANNSGHIDVNWLVHYHWDYLERFAALVAAAERDECAKVCDAIDVEYEGELGWKAAAELRRLHEVNADLIDALQFCSGTSYITDAHRVAEEALAKAEGK